MKQRIAVDMDEVLADTVTKHLECFNRDFGTSFTKQDLAGRHLHNAVKREHRDRVQEYFRSKDFFRDIPMMPQSEEVLKELCGQYEIFVTTAAMEWPNSFTAKYEWIREHFPFMPDSNIVFCGDKSIIAAHFLIDDNAHHFRRFSGQGILFNAPHNIHETRFPRVENWSAVRKRFL